MMPAIAFRARPTFFSKAPVYHPIEVTMSAQQYVTLFRVLSQARCNIPDATPGLHMGFNAAGRITPKPETARDHAPGTGLKF